MEIVSKSYGATFHEQKEGIRARKALETHTSEHIPNAELPHDLK